MTNDYSDPQRVAREELSRYIGERVNSALRENFRNNGARLAEQLTGRTGLKCSTLATFISEVRRGATNYVLGFDRVLTRKGSLSRRLHHLAVLFESLGFSEEDEMILRTREAYSSSGFVYPPQKE